MDQASKLAVVEAYVKSERRRRGIVKLGRAEKVELSGFMHGTDGDIESLIDRQLLTTERGFGSWRELEDPNTLDAALRVIKARSQR
jgi:hypothetical protein